MVLRLFHESCYLVSGPEIVPAGLGVKATRAGNKMFPNCISLTGCSVASHDESRERFVQEKSKLRFSKPATGNGFKNNAVGPESHESSQTSTVVVAFVSHTNYVKGRLATLL